MPRRTLSSLHPAFYTLAVRRKQLARQITWYVHKNHFATKRQGASLPYRVTSHQSLLIRRLGNVDLQLQYNKVHNLNLAIREIDGVLLQPGQTLSLWRLIGPATRARGYMDGLILSNGESTVGIGGGLCQLANLVYWMALHSPLEVTERHHHSFDLFPDSGRTVPFGTGAALFYNYMDLQVHNPTDSAYQLRLWTTEDHLKGEFRADKKPDYSYSILEKNHQYLTDGAQHYRANEIWRQTRNRETGVVLSEEQLYTNCSLMKYQPPEGATVTLRTKM
jgi:vancomycin resistance protein VanW